MPNSEFNPIRESPESPWWILRLSDDQCLDTCFYPNQSGEFWFFGGESGVTSLQRQHYETYLDSQQQLSGIVSDLITKTQNAPGTTFFTDGYLVERVEFPSNSERGVPPDTNAIKSKLAKLKTKYPQINENEVLGKIQSLHTSSFGEVLAASKSKQVKVEFTVVVKSIRPSEHVLRLDFSDVKIIQYSME